MTSRRHFIQRATGAAAAMLLAPAGLLARSEDSPLPAALPAPQTILPKALKAGDTIGVVAPASGLRPKELVDAGKTLEAMGYKVVFGKHLLRRNGYLSGSDDERADDLMTLARREDIDCLMCVRGGYGTMRILPLLDFDVFRTNPKIIIGYSDITALLNAITERTGLVTFHGPVASSKFTPYTVKYFKAVLEKPQIVAVEEIPPYERRTALEVNAPQTLVQLGEGRASGQLVGGNLTMVISMLGTPFEIDTKGKILFLEEVTEEPYRIDRMLTQLWLANKLQSCAAIAFGRLKDCEVRGNSPFADLSLRLRDVLELRISSLGIPAVYGLPIGHVKDKITVPIGARATLDASELKFSIDEPAVS